MASVRIHHGDNFSFVEKGSVDFVLTDPPFNISKKTNFHTYEKNTIHSYQFDGEADEQWDSYTHEEFLGKLNDWSAEWSRVLRKGGNFAVFCADAYVSHLFEAMRANGLQPRRLLVWRKNNAVPVNRAYMPMSANEYIVVGVKKGTKSTFNADVKVTEQTLDERTIEAQIVADKASTIIYSQMRQAILAAALAEESGEDHVKAVQNVVRASLAAAEKSVVEKVTAMYKRDSEGELYLQACVPNYIQHPLKVGSRIHPTEKPIDLLQYLVSLYSNPGDVVLDGFGGSGSTGEASLKLGRQVVLVEREKVFYDNLAVRLAPFGEVEAV